MNTDYSKIVFIQLFYSIFIILIMFSFVFKEVILKLCTSRNQLIFVHATWNFQLRMLFYLICSCMQFMFHVCGIFYCYSILLEIISCLFSLLRVMLSLSLPYAHHPCGASLFSFLFFPYKYIFQQFQSFNVSSLFMLPFGSMSISCTIYYVSVQNRYVLSLHAENILVYC